MNRMMMGSRLTRQCFAARVLAALKSGAVDEDDFAVIAVAVVVAMTCGGVLGGIIMGAIHAYNAQIIGGL